VALSIGDISGAEQELLAYRHHLEMAESRGRQHATNLHALITHCHVIEREWRATVGPAIRPLNANLAGNMREHIGAARRLAESLRH
jgi:hypothetical protein